MYTIATIIVILHQIKFSNVSSFIKTSCKSEIMYWNLEWNGNLKSEFVNGSINQNSFQKTQWSNFHIVPSLAIYYQSSSPKSTEAIASRPEKHIAFAWKA